MNLNLIGQIYESIGDSDSMADVVQSLVALTNSRCAQFGLLDRAGRWVQANEVGGDPVGLDLYVRHYAAEDPRLVYCLDHQGRLYNDKEITGDAETYERSALVNEILNKYDTRFGLCTVFPVAPNYSAGLAVMRAQRDGSYGNSEFKKLAILLPHFQRAMSLHVRLGRLESRLASIDALADRLSSPVLLVDRTGALQHANSSGQEALRGAEYLSAQKWARAATESSASAAVHGYACSRSVERSYGTERFNAPFRYRRPRCATGRSGFARPGESRRYATG